jgi:hypothetical protein
MTLNFISCEDANIKPRQKYSQEELREGFDRVCNKTNWKLPIMTNIEFKDEDDIRLLTDAIIHFTGSVPRFYVYESKNGKKRVKVNAIGYYEAIGA